MILRFQRILTNYKESAQKGALESVLLKCLSGCRHLGLNHFKFVLFAVFISIIVCVLSFDLYYAWRFFFPTKRKSKKFKWFWWWGCV